MNQGNVKVVPVSWIKCFSLWSVGSQHNDTQSRNICLQLAPTKKERREEGKKKGRRGGGDGREGDTDHN